MSVSDADPGKARNSLLFLVIALGFLSMLGPISLDLFIPTIPAIAEDLGTSANVVAQSITAIILGNALGLLFHGPLADRFGRKPVILGILGLYTFSALGAAFASSVELLILWRFFQGMAQAGGRILAATVARDLFDKERLGRLIADTLVVAAIATIAAPITGGQIASRFPWQAAFLLMAGFGALVFLLFLIFFAETLKERNPAAGRPAHVITTVWTIFRNQAFLKYGFCNAFVIAGFVGFMAGSSTILIRGYGIGADVYGFLFASVSAFHLLTTVASGRLVMRLGIDRLIGWGCALAIVGGGLMAALALAGVEHAAAVIVPMQVYIIGLSLLFPQTQAGALQPFPHVAGMASSSVGLLQNLLAAVTGALVGASSLDDARFMSVIIFACALAAGLIYFTRIRTRSRPAGS